MCNLFLVCITFVYTLWPDSITHEIRISPIREIMDGWKSPRKNQKKTPRKKQKKNQKKSLKRKDRQNR